MRQKIIEISKSILAIVILVLLYMSSRHSYILFHVLSEIFSIIIAFTVFVLTWTSYRYIKNNYLIVLGIAYGFVGLIDLFHTLSFKGMPIFTDYDYYANQLWIAARLFESVVILLAVASTQLKKCVNVYLISLGYAIVTTALMLSVFVWKNFPICFIAGEGLTPFKKISEYVICAILLMSLYLLTKFKKTFDEKVYRYLFIAIVFTIVSEIAFTFYINNYDISNLIGHYFKIFAFFMVYKVIIKMGIQEPYEIIFREMQQTQEKLSEQNEVLMNLSTRDGLTGLYNHRYLYDRLEEEVKRHKRLKNEFVVMMLDIDHFKDINDTYGHVLGDAILKQLAGIFKTQLRQTDIVGRYGGEEFMVIFVNTNLEMGFKVAEKIRILIERFIFEEGVHITISCGIKKYAGESINMLIDGADDKMYEAKRDGRNRTKM